MSTHSGSAGVDDAFLNIPILHQRRLGPFYKRASALADCWTEGKSADCSLRTPSGNDNADKRYTEKTMIAERHRRMVGDIRVRTSLVELSASVGFYSQRAR